MNSELNRPAFGIVPKLSLVPPHLEVDLSTSLPLDVFAAGAVGHNRRPPELPKSMHSVDWPVTVPAHQLGRRYLQPYRRQTCLNQPQIVDHQLTDVMESARDAACAVCGQHEPAHSAGPVVSRQRLVGPNIDRGEQPPLPPPVP